MNRRSFLKLLVVGAVGATLPTVPMFVGECPTRRWYGLQAFESDATYRSGCYFGLPRDTIYFLNRDGSVVGKITGLEP